VSSHRGPMKRSIDDLAVFGSTAAFQDTVCVGRPRVHDRTLFLDKVDEILQRNWLTNNGPCVQEFESELQEALGVRHCIATCNGTLALCLTVKALDLKGEAIVPSFTFIATAHALLWQGITPVFCDINPDNHTLDPKLVEKSITNKTTAILATHLWGNPCEIESLERIASRHELKLIFDAAHAFGSRYDGKLIGSFGDAEVFSFHATKNLVTGEGGCLVTDDKKLAEKAYIMREKGTNKRSMVVSGQNIGYFEYQDKGHSYIQSNILGALALSQLKKLDRMNGKRREHARYLNDGLKDVSGIEIPFEAKDVESNWAIYGIRVLNGNLIRVRDALRAEGIECNTHYHPLHINSYYRNMLHCREEDFPQANRVHGTLLRLPMYPQLTRQDLDDIIATVRKVMGLLAH